MLSDIARPADTGRLFFLDWLRIIAFAVLVPYHVSMYYVTWDFHVKSPFAGPALEPFMQLTSPWRMCLLFIVSGAASAFMLKRGSGFAFVGERSRRLLLPLVCGMVLVVPPQAYFEVVQKFGYAGSYIDFLALYFDGYHGFCTAGHCLTLPTWNHLWFLPYLWAYTLLLWALLKAAPGALPWLARGADRLLRGPALLWVPIAALLLVRIGLHDRYPSTHAMAGDWFNHAQYVGMFLSGVLFVQIPDVWDRFAALRWAGLPLALLCWGVQMTAATSVLVDQALYAGQQWGALVACIGFARRHLNADHPWRATLTEAVFPVYILHQTLIVVASQWLKPLGWAPVVEGPVLIAATFALSALGYAIVRRVGPLRPWFGLGRQADSGARRATRQVVVN